VSHARNAEVDCQRLLATLEQLLSIEGTTVETTLDRASDLIVKAIGAEKIDTFLYDPSTESLVAVGTSNTPMARRQREIGLDRIALANGGHEAQAFYTGDSYHIGDARQDPQVAPGMVRGLGVRSILVVPMPVNGEHRGVIQACSSHVDAFSDADLSFLQAVAFWIGTVTHRAELAERIARDSAAQARQAVAEELITILAHDLGNYMTPLKARLGLIVRRARRGGEGSHSYLEDAEAASHALTRLQSLVYDLLDTSRIEQGIFSIVKEPVDIVALVEETVGMMTTGKLDTLVTAPDELKVEGDPARVRQALENLLANALKHSPNGVPVEVEVAREKREDGAWAVITVRDGGPGIPSDLRPRLFTRFASGPDSKGLGLGLYLAHNIARAHGGTLALDGATDTNASRTDSPGAGPGATFKLSLPVAQ
jgi:two-component system OmpR family sensor kinase